MKVLTSKIDEVGDKFHVDKFSTEGLNMKQNKQITKIHQQTYNFCSASCRAETRLTVYCANSVTEAVVKKSRSQRESAIWGVGNRKLEKTSISIKRTSPKPG